MRYMTMLQHHDLYLTISDDFPRFMQNESRDVSHTMFTGARQHHQLFVLCKLSTRVRYSRSTDVQDIGMKSAHGVKPDSAVMLMCG